MATQPITEPDLEFLVPSADIQEYKRHLASITNQYRPVTEEEISLVDRIAGDRWRQKRLYRIEKNLYDYCAQQHLEEAAKLTADTGRVYLIAEVRGFYENHKIFDMIFRQQGRLDRLLLANIKQLYALIATRCQPEPAVVSAKPDHLEGVPHQILDSMPNFVGKSAEKHQKEWLKKHWPM